jgi:nucleoside-diphosphate-sugar epimerase
MLAVDSIRSKGRVLLTGGTGFIGSHAIAPLMAAGYEVHGLARRPGGSVGVVWHDVDLFDRDAVAKVVAEISAEHMLHLAWYTEHGRFWTSPDNLEWIGASLRLLRAFSEAGGRRVVMAGTCAEYDWSRSQERCLELPRSGRHATMLAPASLYGAAKHATHLAAGAYAREIGLSFAWGRIFMLYGPGEDSRRLIAHVAGALLRGQEASTTDGRQIRDFMHVEDVARAFAALVDSHVEGPFNIGSGQGVSIRHVLDLIGEATNRADLLRVGLLPHRDGEPERLVADVVRLRDEVGFVASTGLDDGIAQMVNHMRVALERRAS